MSEPSQLSGEEKNAAETDDTADAVADAATVESARQSVESISGNLKDLYHQEMAELRVSTPFLLFFVSRFESSVSVQQSNNQTNKESTGRNEDASDHHRDDQARRARRGASRHQARDSLS